LLTRDGKWVIKPSKALAGVGAVFGKVFQGTVGGGGGQMAPFSISGKVLVGPYKGDTMDTAAQDIQNGNMAIMAMISLSKAEASYSADYPAKGFASSFAALGPAQDKPDANHAGLIDAVLASGSTNGYQYAISIPAGTSTGGTNFNYFIVGKPTAGHAGQTYCADSTGSVHSAMPGEECTTASPTAWSPQQETGTDTPQTSH